MLLIYWITSFSSESAWLPPFTTVIVLNNFIIFSHHSPGPNYYAPKCPIIPAPIIFEIMPAH